MSSSFGGSGSSGSSGQIRYTIAIDDSQVNQKLGNFQSTLGRLNTATQTSASQFQVLSNSMQEMDSAVSTATKDLDAINNNFRSMDSAVVSTSKSMGALANNFKGVEGGLTRSNTLLGQGSEATQTFGQKMKSAGGFIKDNALAFGLVSSSVIDLVSSYTSLQKSQNTVQRTQDLDIRQKHLIEIQQRKVTEAIKQYGAGSIQAKDATNKLNDMLAKNGTLVQKLTIMQQQLNEKQASFFQGALNDAIVFGSGVAQIAGTASSNFGRIKLGIESATGAIGGLKTALIGLSGPLAVLTAGAVLAYQGWQTMNDAMKAMDQAVPGQINKLNSLEMAWLKIKIVLGQATEAEKKMFEAAEKQQDAIVNNLNKVQIPPLERIFGLSDDTKAKLQANIKETMTGLESITQGALTASDGVKTLNDAANPLGMKTLPTLSSESTKLSSSLSNVTDSTKKSVVETIIARNKATELRDNWDDLWASGVNLGKVLTDNTGKQFTYNQTLEKWVPIAEKVKSSFDDVGGAFNSVMEQVMGTATSIARTWDDAGIAQALEKQMDDAVKATQSGLDRITEAFHNTQKGKLDFEVDMSKAEKKIEKFLGNVAEELDDGGSEGAKKYVESYIEEAESKMKGAAKIQFQPIFDFVEQHKGDDAASWMEAFLQLIGDSEKDTKEKFTQLLIEDKEWKKFGKNSGESWTEGFKDAMDDAKREANKAAADIEKALHIGKGDLSFDIDSKAMGGLVTSAASGRMFTTRGPTLTLAGDNPGGKETVAYIPHNNPGPTLAKVDRMFGTRSYNNGNQPIIINLANVTKIDGNGIINDRELKKTIKMEVGTLDRLM